MWLPFFPNIMRMSPSRMICPQPKHAILLVGASSMGRAKRGSDISKI